jgi:sulfur carrier protein ThiS
MIQLMLSGVKISERGIAISVNGPVVSPRRDLKFTTLRSGPTTPLYDTLSIMA